MNRILAVPILVALCLATAGSGYAQQSPSLQDLVGLTGKPGITTVYVAHEFLTMDSKQPRAEVVAVRDGRFVAVGTLDKVKEVAGKDAKIDRTFADKVVIAGFVEQHVHPVSAALTMNTKVISIEDQGAGYQIHVHNNGDAGFDVVLGELQKAMKAGPRKDHRTTLVHFGFAQADQVKKWIELGGIVSSNPYYVTALAGPYEKIGIGPDRAKNIAPHKYVLDNKGSLSFHSDMPMAQAKPLQLVWAGVNRLTYEGKVAGPEHKVPLETAL